MDAAERQPETADRAVAETTDAAGASARRRWRFQYSLASLMWVTTVAACLCRDVRHVSEAGKRRGDRKVAKVSRTKWATWKSRDPEQGRTPETIRSVDPNKWSWRVYLPRGRIISGSARRRSRSPRKALPERCRAIQRPVAIEESNLVDLETAAGTGRPDWRCHHCTTAGYAVRRFDVARARHGEQRGVVLGAGIGRARGPLGPLARAAPHGDREAPTMARRYWFALRDPCDGLMIWIEEQK